MHVVKVKLQKILVMWGWVEEQSEGLLKVSVELKFGVVVGEEAEDESDQGDAVGGD